jgi:hypothetical protein
VGASRILLARHKGSIAKKVMSLFYFFLREAGIFFSWVGRSVRGEVISFLHQVIGQK